MDENFNKSTIVTRGLSFSFDIVIVNLNLTDVNFRENSKFKIDLKFNNNSIKISSSRINVNEFKPPHSLEFIEEPLTLKDQLFKNPLTCDVYYDNEPVGNCIFIWPESFINCIGVESRELTHCDVTDIKKGNQVIGRMDILARLQIKCPELVENQVLLKPKMNFCHTSDNVLNPSDVMFVVGENNNGSNVCTDVAVISATESATSAYATCLDLSDLRQVHGTILPNTDILESIDVQCCKTQKISNKYKQIITNLLERSEKNSLKKRPKKKLHEVPSCQGFNHLDLISSDTWTSCSSTDSSQPCYCISDENLNGANGIMCGKNSLIEKPTKRYCPLCNNNISWLPKFATCPKCGFKPILYNVQEKPYDDALTASKILREFSNDTHKETKESSCHCTCKNGEICAHCRVKKLCEDIFQPPHRGDGDCSICEVKSSDLYNICKTDGPDCLPYLSRVCNELKNLYGLSERTEKDNVVVGRDVDLNKSLRDIHEIQEVNKTRKKEQNCYQPESNGACGNAECRKIKRANNNTRKCNVMKNRHKNCLSGKTIVPHNMGWLWNVESKGLRTGWMPGAIRKPIHILMHHFLDKNSALQVKKTCDNIEQDAKEPILHIRKNNGVYYVTLRPLRGAATSSECSEDMNKKFIEFQISKNPTVVKISQLKRHLKDMGFGKCICHKPISTCCCRGYIEKKKLEYQCRKECHKKDLLNCTDELILSDTTDSEAEFELGVSPPAETMLLNSCLKMSKTVSTATQYLEDDWEIREQHSKSAGKLYNCAVGNRFGKAFGPYGIKGYRPGAIPTDGIYESNRKKGRTRNGIRGMAVRGPELFRGPDGKFNMAQYIAYKASIKPSPKEIAENKRRKMALLSGEIPPLLCQVDRRRKAIDNCCPCLPIHANDSRIC